MMAYRLRKLLTKRETRAVHALALLFILSFTGTVFGAYRTFPFIDLPMHFLGGFFVAYFFIDFFRQALIAERGFWRDAIILIGASLVVGVFWEIFEFAASALFGEYLALKTGQPCCIGTLADTLKDLVVDSLGAFSLFLIIRRRHRRSPMFR